MQVGQAASRRESLAEKCIGCFRANLICPSSRIQTRLSRAAPTRSVPGGDSISRRCRTNESELSRATPSKVTLVVFALWTNLSASSLEKHTIPMRKLKEESEYILLSGYL